MVKVSVASEQSTPALLNVGVTLTVATIGDVPELTAVKLGIEPVPDVGLNPMEASILHAYVVVPPVFCVLKLISD